MAETTVTGPETLYIEGTWVASSDGGTRTVTCPADGEVVGVVSEATSADTEKAIAAARRAFDSGVWSSVPAGERGDFLLKVADALVERKDEIARVPRRRSRGRAARSCCGSVPLSART